ncbi:MAG TPA: MaoC/PaaZ C-terminal domain-containing protein [Solirubrobacteraceae bacterium]|nr:MaoC/PaaZ C-terminal domain-containing protein [Solirubrobacteraceae bacterium]
MVTRELDSAPGFVGLYARTLAPLVPGASRLPWVGGGGREIPDLALSLMGARAEPGRVAEYARVCGFLIGEELPATYPHVLAFPLHLALMADPSFPFAAVGLVHVANEIAQLRPLGLGERLDLRVHATPLQEHPRGRVFSLVSEARIGDELVWRELSTMLRRGGGGGGAGGGGGGGGGKAPAEELATPSAPFAAEWQLPGDLGRRYAAVSGDRNPIHLHPLSARALGFPRAIAHGMWTKARCLAALQQDEAARGTLAGAFSVQVRFRRPILLPARVGFASAADGEGAFRFGVRDAASDTDHLDGRLQPLAGGQLPPLEAGIRAERTAR